MRCIQAVFSGGSGGDGESKDQIDQALEALEKVRPFLCFESLLFPDNVHRLMESDR